MQVQLIINIIILGAIYSLIAKSFEIIYRTISLFLLTHALTVSIGAYLLYYLIVVHKYSIVMSLVVAIVFSIILAIALYFVLYKPLREKKRKSWEIMIVSLGAYVASINIITIIFGNQILSFGFSEIAWTFCSDKFFITNIQLVSLSVSVFLLVATFVYEKTSSGQMIKASSSNSDLSVIMGINYQRIAFVGLAIGTCLACMSGIIIAIDVNISTSIGFDWLMYGVVAMIIGGMGKIRYMFLGAFLLATAQHLSAYFLDSKWMNATAYIILVIFLYFRPFGFSGKKLKKTEV